MRIEDLPWEKVTDTLKTITKKTVTILYNFLFVASSADYGIALKCRTELGLCMIYSPPSRRKDWPPLYRRDGMSEDGRYSYYYPVL